MRYPRSRRPPVEFITSSAGVAPLARADYRPHAMSSAAPASVPLLDLTRLSSDEVTAYVSTFTRVLKSGHFILGPEVDAFERECAELVGVKHALGVSSGTDALILALMALDIGPGDEVICPTFTFFATAGAVWRVGAKPVFVDVSPTTFNIEAAAIERAITPKTRAIMPVHLFGQCAEMDPIVALAKARNLHIIEDSAQAILATDNGRQTGAFGAFACFSFFPSKNLGGFGDSGLVTTNDDALAAKARMLRVHGMQPKYYHQLVGGNFRIDALQAALLRHKVPKVKADTDARRRNAKFYLDTLEPLTQKCAITLPHQQQAEHTWNQFTIRVHSSKRDALQAFLRERKIGSEVYYPVCLHQQACFSSLGYIDASFPHAVLAAKEVLALPVFPGLTQSELDYVANSIHAFFQG